MTNAVRLILGCGYLGKRVARIWREGGSKVIATVRSPDRLRELESLGVEPIAWDVVRPPDRDLPTAETVLYAVGYDQASGQSHRAIRVDGLRNTLARLPNPGLLIFISSTGVHGDCGGDWIDEDSPTAPTDPSASAYVEAEELLWTIANERNIPAIVLRLAGLYGPGRMIGAQRLQQGLPIEADPDAFLNLIHVEDAARVVEAVRRRGRPGSVYLVSDGRPVRRREFYNHVAELLGTAEPQFLPGSSRRDRGSRRIRNDKLSNELAVEFLFADYRNGLADALRDQD